MRPRLHRRLQQLEEANAQVRKQDEWRDKEADEARIRRRVELFLRICGVERGARESLAEAWARALEITCYELRQLLSAGIDPIHKLLTERRLYEALKKAKTPRTNPRGRWVLPKCRLFPQ